MDRNNAMQIVVVIMYASLSARRAWIEIAVDSASGTLSDVALRKESVDRNYYADKDADWVRVSLSARRAWIEICRSWRKQSSHRVALRKESVDRNNVR